MCDLVDRRDEPVIFEDLLDEQELESHPIHELNVRFYAGFPLRTSAGAVQGTLCVYDQRPRLWTPSDQALLQDLAYFAEQEIQHQFA